MKEGFTIGPEGGAGEEKRQEEEEKRQENEEQKQDDGQTKPAQEMAKETEQAEGASEAEPAFGLDLLHAPNLWPAADAPAGFRAALTEYFEAMTVLTRAMFRLLALSLDLAEDYFDEALSGSDYSCSMRANHYPPSPSGSGRGVGAHTDFGLLTLLLQDNGECKRGPEGTKRSARLCRADARACEPVGGLQVFHRPSQTWHAVPPVPGALVVNIGDLLGAFPPVLLPGPPVPGSCLFLPSPVLTSSSVSGPHFFPPSPVPTSPVPGPHFPRPPSRLTRRPVSRAVDQRPVRLDAAPRRLARARGGRAPQRRLLQRRPAAARHRVPADVLRRGRGAALRARAGGRAPVAALL
ncbi:hypothetical protein CDD83_5555 [Cordyceps sp. RAO-2017]|nr:hypothetical protein CDD83_5555 [Cordyceps sp. RAO-2017]